MTVLATDRECGPCTLCCSHFAVPELNKPAGVPCVNLQAWGCQIHATRPPVCRNYECAWRQGMMTEGMRPDKSGLIVSLPSLANEVSRLTGITPLIVEPLFSGAESLGMNEAELSELSATNVLILKRPDGHRTVIGPSDLVDKVFPILERLTVSRPTF